MKCTLLMATWKGILIVIKNHMYMGVMVLQNSLEGPLKSRELVGSNLKKEVEGFMRSPCRRLQGTLLLPDGDQTMRDEGRDKRTL